MRTKFAIVWWWWWGGDAGSGEWGAKVVTMNQKQQAKRNVHKVRAPTRARLKQMLKATTATAATARNATSDQAMRSSKLDAVIAEAARARTNHASRAE